MKTATPFLTKAFLLFSLFAVFSVVKLSAQTHFDYDSKVDLAVFRPSEGNWYSFSSETQTSTTTRWGLATDRLVPADFDGDGLTDIAVWRVDTGNWYILHSRDRVVEIVNWGTKMFIPNEFVSDEPEPADFDGDGHADYAVWRPVTGVWYVLKSSSGFNPKYAEYFQWGRLGDIPVAADYDGDGKADFAVFRSTENRWYVYQSSDHTWKTSVFGQAGYDRLVPADYTGDGQTDFAIYRNGTWLIEDSATREVYTFQFGLATDTAVPADYNGDGMAELAVFRDGTWYIKETISGNTYVYNYGMAGDIPVTSLNVKGSIVPIP
jgi:spore coat protein A